MKIKLQYMLSQRGFYVLSDNTSYDETPILGKGVMTYVGTKLNTTKLRQYPIFVSIRFQIFRRSENSITGNKKPEVSLWSPACRGGRI